MAMKLTSSEFSKVFEHDPGSDILYDSFANAASCYPLTIYKYETLKRIVAEAQSNQTITDSKRRHKIDYFSKMLPDLKMCYFFPHDSWTSQDVQRWFRHIGFTPPDIDLSQLTGQEFLDEYVFRLFTEAEWKQLLIKYEDYCQSLQVHWPELEIRKLRDIDQVRQSMTPEDVQYVGLPYSGEDFMAVVKEIVTNSPYMPPGHTEINPANINFFAPCAVMVQSSCTGKTRFLLDPVKEDADCRSFVIYLTMQSGFDGSYWFRIMLLGWLEKCSTLYKITDLLNNAYNAFIDVLVEKEGDKEYLKQVYCKKGSIMVDELLDKLDKPLSDNNLEHERGGSRPLIVRSEDGKEKELIVVFAIDEAQILLERERTDTPDLAGEYGKSSQVNFFKLLRRAVIVAGVHHNLTIPIIFTSNDTRICNFLPVHLAESSRRYVPGSDIISRPRFLHRPMLLQESMDVWARQISVSQPYDAYLKSEEYIVNLFYHGRPYWGTLQKASHQKYPRCQDDILLMAGRKLLASYPNPVPAEVNALALLGQTVYIEPLAGSNFASKLVECRMGFLQMFDNLQHKYIATVYPEPVLSLAATNVLFDCRDSDSSFKLENVLKVFSRMTEIGQADVGAEGEFVVRLGFYVARMLAKPAVPKPHEANHGLKHAYPRKLTDVLNLLAPIDVKHCINTNYTSIYKEPIGAVHDVINEEVLDSMINFTHWIKLKSLEKIVNNVKVPLDFDHILEQALIRSSALIMPDRNYGVDLAIPMVTKSERLGALFIQVKHYVDTKSQSVNFREMASFAESMNMQGRCLHALALIYSKKDEQKAVISALDAETLEGLQKPGEVFPGIFIHGINYNFDEERVKGKKVGPFLNIERPFLDTESIESIRAHLADLSDVYRSARCRFFPKYAHYFQRNERIFKQPEETQASEAMEREIPPTSAVRRFTSLK